MSLINEFSLQLYSLREETAKDFDTVLGSISKMGYTGVEFAGYGDIPAEAMNELLKKHALKSVGSHIPAERFLHNLDEELAYNKIIGTETLVIPYCNLASAQDVDALAATIKKIAPAIKQAGFGFAYHNHAHEFEMVNGTFLLDLLLQAVPAEDLSLELDVYWAAYAGVDPMEYLAKHNSRTSLIHVKQIKDMETKQSCDLDEGMIDFSKLIPLAQKGATKHFILEQESFKADPYASVQTGYTHIMSL